MRELGGHRTTGRTTDRHWLGRILTAWSVPDARLCSEAFMGRARAIARCTWCLEDDHSEAAHPKNLHRPTFEFSPDPSTLAQPSHPTHKLALAPWAPILWARARNLPSVQQRQVFKASLQTSPCVLVMLWATPTDGLPSDAPSVSSSARSPSSSTSKRAARTPLALMDGWPRQLELTQHRTLLLKTITGQTMPRVMT